jgi:hypothetical protein
MSAFGAAGLGDLAVGLALGILTALGFADFVAGGDGDGEPAPRQ